MPVFDELFAVENSKTICQILLPGNFQYSHLLRWILSEVCGEDTINNGIMKVYRDCFVNNMEALLFN